jgi:phospholipid transport system substrate-binding protein
VTLSIQLEEIEYMKLLIPIALICFVLSQAALGAESDDPQEFLKSKLDAIISILQNQDLDQEEKKTRVLERVTPLFDFYLMAKLTLGRKYWPGLSEENKRKFTDIFVKRLKDSYVGNLNLYTDEKVVYGAGVQKGSKIQIPTYVVSKDNKISMLFKLYRSKTGWKIYDAEIQGVSVVLSYRSQFNQVLKDGTFEDLLAELEKQAEETDEQIDVTDTPIMKQ